NDAGPDKDFDDLVLTCSAPQTLTDFFVYGHVSYYAGVCIFNPCWRDWIVIDSAAALAAALKNPTLKVPIEKLYPFRRPVPPVPPGPTPDPAPFTPLVIPLREQTALPAKQAQVFRLAPEQVTRAASAEPAVQTFLSSRTVTTRQAGAGALVDFDRLA